MDEKITIVAGAGCTLSDATTKPKKSQPPLDNGFFRSLQLSGLTSTSDYRTVQEYLREHYSIDPLTVEDDSLEQIMAILYSDIHVRTDKGKAAAAFRGLVRLLNKKIAETTNYLDPGNKGNFYSLVSNLLKRGVRPKNITIITFNYDLQVEKALFRIQSTKRWSTFGMLFSFPYSYALPEYKVSKAPDSEPQFSTGDDDGECIRVLKLHGSLNWFSKHNSPNPTPRSLLNRNRDLTITPRRRPLSNLRYKGSRRQYTFPVIIPPVINKAAILHNDLVDVWRQARASLLSASRICVFGYSCPQSDFESANLMRRGIRNNLVLESLSVIDPSTNAFQRFADLSGLNSLHYYRNMKAFTIADCEL